MKAGFILNISSVLILTLGVNTWGAEFFLLRNLPVELAATSDMSSGNDIITGSDITTVISAVNATLTI